MKRDTPKAKLTDKQDKQYKTFAQNYIIKFNGKDAAIEAGYSEKTATSQASRLLTHVKVQEYIRFYIKEREKRTEITGDMVVQELAKTAFHDIRKLYDDDGRLIPVHQLDNDTAAVISSFKERREYQGKDEDGTAEYAMIDEYKRYDKTKDTRW